MQDKKNTTWTHDHGASEERDAAVIEREPGDNAGSNKESDGWQQYRRWISKAPAPRSRRSGVDPSLYTWKGYRNWSEQVKRDWTDS